MLMHTEEHVDWEPLRAVLLLTTATCAVDLGERITIPEAARREPTRIDELPALLRSVDLLAEDLERTVRLADDPTHAIWLDDDPETSAAPQV
jgi:hypothetical protein